MKKGIRRKRAIFDCGKNRHVGGKELIGKGVGEPSMAASS